MSGASCDSAPTGAKRHYPKDSAVSPKREAFAAEAQAAAIARVAHEVNRAYCASMGDHSQPPWESAPGWQKDSALAGVRAHLASDLTPEQSHESWLAVKRADGWTYGPVKDPERKQHPCFVSYYELPPEQRAKDHLFRAVVHACRAYRMELI